MNLVEIIDVDGYKHVRIRRPEGRAILKSLHTTSQEEAIQKVRAAKLEEIARADHANALTAEVWTRMISGRNVRVRDAVEQFLQHRVIVGIRDVLKEQRILDAFLCFTGLSNQPIAVIEERHVVDFVNRPGTQGLVTRKGWLIYLSIWLGYCVDKRWLLSNPAVDVVVRLDGLTQEQLVSKSYQAFTEEEIHRLLACIPRENFWHGAALFGYHFGLRLCTVANLEESNIVANVLRVYTTKGGRIVNERLPDQLIDWLTLWRQHRPHSDMPYLFPVQAAAGGSLLSRQFRNILKKHAFKDRVFHSLRKTATAKRWNSALEELGGPQARALARLVAENGFRAVQAMLAHAPGSDVTEKHYMPRA